MVGGSRIRVLVADDHPVVREGLVAILNAERDMIVVDQAADGQEAVAAFHKYKPDVTLIDLVMPRMSGLDAIGEILSEFPNARILVLTTFRGEEDIYRALQMGARGYLLKGTPKNELIDAIRDIHAGLRRIPPDIASTLAERLSFAELTPRETDVLKLIVKGKSNKEIAAELQISEGTVKGHVNVILNKMGVSDRTQAATTALRKGIVRLE